MQVVSYITTRRKEINAKSEHESSIIADSRPKILNDCAFKL